MTFAIKRFERIELKRKVLIVKLYRTCRFRQTVNHHVNHSTLKAIVVEASINASFDPI